MQIIVNGLLISSKETKNPKFVKSVITDLDNGNPVTVLSPVLINRGAQDLTPRKYELTGATPSNGGGFFAEDIKVTKPA